MSELVEMLVIHALFLTAAFRGNNSRHAAGVRIVNDRLCVVVFIRQQKIRKEPINQVYSFCAISSGTLCDKYSDRHTIRIHGKVNFGIEPPFVRLIS